MQDQKSFYISLSSKPDQFVNPGNTPNRFIHTLKHTLDFSSRDWEVRMVHTVLPKPLHAYPEMVMCMAGLENGMIGNQAIPMLAVLPTAKKNTGNQVFYSDIYVQITMYSTRDIEMYILDDNLEKVAFEDRPVRVTLHFRRSPTSL